MPEDIDILNFLSDIGIYFKCDEYYVRWFIEAQRGDVKTWIQ